MVKLIEVAKTAFPHMVETAATGSPSLPACPADDPG